MVTFESVNQSAPQPVSATQPPETMARRSRTTPIRETSETFRQDHHPVGDPRQCGDVVRGNEHRGPGRGTVRQHSQDCGGVFGIELGRGFVADQHVRVQRQGTGHHGPLELAIRDLVRVAVQERRIQLRQLGQFGKAPGMAPRMRTP